VRGAINSPYANKASAVFYTSAVLPRAVRAAERGMFAPIRIVLPEGCWLNGEMARADDRLHDAHGAEDHQRRSGKPWRRRYPIGVTGPRVRMQLVRRALKDAEGHTSVLSDLPRVVGAAPRSTTE